MLGVCLDFCAAQKQKATIEKHKVSSFLFIYLFHGIFSLGKLARSADLQWGLTVAGFLHWEKKVSHFYRNLSLLKCIYDEYYRPNSDFL